MAILVSLAGVFVAATGLLGVAAPARFVDLLGNWRILTRLPVTLGVRIAFGSVFVIAAPDCRLPTLVRLIGFLEFGAALALLGLGGRRLGPFVDWWLEQSPSFVRYWCLAALALGIALVYAGA